MTNLTAPAKQRRIDLDLSGHIRHRGLRNLAGMAWETASNSKYLSKTLKPRRVTEVLLPIRRQSSSSNVHDSISSSGVHSRRTSTPVVQIPPMVAAPYDQARTYLGAGVSYGSAWPDPRYGNQASVRCLADDQFEAPRSSIVQVLRSELWCSIFGLGSVESAG